MDFAKLRGRMVEKGISQEDLARRVGISFNSLSRKLNGKTQFTIEEAVKISQILELSDPATYFFTYSVPEMQR